jgi:hypothetical protein
MPRGRAFKSPKTVKWLDPLRISKLVEKDPTVLKSPEPGESCRYDGSTWR